MKKLLLALLFLALPVSAQTLGIVDGATPIVGGSTGQCVTKNAAGVVSMAACGGAPSGAAGGVLSGSYPNPGFATTPIFSGGAAGGVLSGTYPNPGFAATGVAVPVVTYASLPAAGTAGRMLRVSNAGTSGSLWVDTGVRWKPVGGCATLITLNTPSSAIANTSTIVTQYQMQPNMLQAGDRLRLRLTATKSGTTDQGVITVYVGTGGTTSDTSVFSGSVMVAANQTAATDMDFRLDDATHLLKLGSPSAPFGYSASSNSALAASVAISSAVSNSLYVSVAINSNGVSNTVTLVDAQILLCASGT